MDELTIKDLNCDTCKNDECDWHPDQAPFPEEVTFFVSDLREVIKETGCASHPLALQVLAGPVIERLESQKATLRTYLPMAFRVGGIEMADRAIKLLKEGVH